MFPLIFKVSETPAVVEQNWSGAPEQIGQYFQSGQIPTQQIAPAQRNVSVDTNKLQALAAMSSNPLESLSTMAKLVPDLRKAGFTGGQQNLENPFAIFAKDQTIPVPLRQVAANYQKSYDAGLIDQETADKRLAELGARVQSAQQFAQTQESLAAQRQQANALQAQMLDIRKAAEANKPEQFSYSQKKDFDVIQQSMDDAKKASTNAVIAQRAAPLLEQAYSGVIEAGAKGLVGAAGFETEAKTANDQLSRFSNQLAVNAPKFSGPTSDRDAARYDAAVGDLANPRKTVESKRQALKDIQELSKKAQSYATQQENWFYNNNKSLRGFKFSENPYDGM
jgi:predicted  nucleic acid-binding Zn-ribbon protein